MNICHFSTALFLLFMSASAIGQSHHTYSGPYPLNGYDGKAEYSYFTNSDGTRIYDGPFKFTAGGYLKVTGNYKDNRQTGQWDIYDARGYDDENLTITFKDGIVDGEVSYYIINSSDNPIKTYSFMFRNGVAHGDFVYKDIESETLIKGAYINGIPSGTWILIFRGDDNAMHEAQLDLDSTPNNSYYTVYYIDQRTGDKTEHTVWMDSMLESPLRTVLSEIENCIMRDSKGLRTVDEVRKLNALVHSSVEEQPQYPGGEAALLKDLCANIRYPSKAQENGIEGKVVVKFVITMDGKIGDIEVIRGRDPDLDKEAIRVVRTLKDFIPGKMNGRPVNVWYTLPITFRCQK